MEMRVHGGGGDGMTPASQGENFVYVADGSSIFFRRSDPRSVKRFGGSISLAHAETLGDQFDQYPAFRFGVVRRPQQPKERARTVQFAVKARINVACGPNR